MAKLYFYYAAMNAGKTTTLLQSDFNYRERGLNTFLYTAAIDDRFGEGVIASRIGLDAPAHLFNETTAIFSVIEKAHKQKDIHCILVDEAQFLSEKQVNDLAKCCDKFSIPVLCYGLRTDFQGELFSGSKRLLAIADELRELKTICACGSKATMNLRIDEKGEAIKIGEQTEVGGNESYISMCRKHFDEALS